MFASPQAALPALLYTDNARYRALGDAGGAVCFDEGAVSFNPAGLFFLERGAPSAAGLQYSHEYLIPEYLGTETPYECFGLFGRYKDLAAMALTRKTVDGGGYFSDDEYTIVTLSSDLERSGAPSNYAIGVNFKFIHSSFDLSYYSRQGEGPSLNSIAMDAGYLYREPFLGIFSGRVTLQNMGADVAYLDQSQKDPIPFNLKLSLGATYEVPKLLKATAVLDFNKELVRRRDDDKTIRENGGPQDHDPFWKAFFTAWQDDGWDDERAEIIRSYGIELLMFNSFAVRWGRMVDKAGGRWERTYGCGYEYKYCYFSIASIQGLEHEPYGFASGDNEDYTTARIGQTQYTLGIKLPL
jgi:hypothetical protein